MPPFSVSIPPNEYPQSKKPDPYSNIVTIDVGGRLFQTTKQTLSSAGPNSLFSTISTSDDCFSHHFIDRDPDLFSLLLSLLRTGHLPSKANSLDFQDLISEAAFYGVETLLAASHSDPSQLDPFNLEKSSILPLNGRDPPSAISATPAGWVHVAHGGKITSFDWSLRRKSTVLTELPVVDSLSALSPAVAAAGAVDFSGLQVIDLEKGFVVETLNWENSTRSSSTVQAIGSSPDYLFASFESGRRNSNAIMVYDRRRDGFLPVSEIGRSEIFGANLESAIPATKLSWVYAHNLLMASGSHSGPSGVSGNIKFWDLRSGNAVWEVKEKVDCFSDITVSENLSAVFKVGVNSGEVFFADLRRIGGENWWVRMRNGGKVIGNGKKKEGFGCKIESCGNQVVCSRGGNLELWSEVAMVGSSLNSGGIGMEERVFRKNLMGRGNDHVGGSRINQLGVGGNKMFVTRKDQQCVEVWQSPVRGF